MAEIVISDVAARKLDEIIERESPPPGSGLRIYVDHRCHCGGLKYGMALDRPHPGDQQVTVSGLTVHVAPEVASQPGTARIGYLETALGTGLTLENSEHSCGPMQHR